MLINYTNKNKIIILSIDDIVSIAVPFLPPPAANVCFHVGLLIRLIGACLFHPDGRES